MFKKLILTAITLLFALTSISCNNSSNHAKFESDILQNTSSKTSDTIFKQSAATDNIVSDAKMNASVVDTDTHGYDEDNQITTETLDNSVEIIKDSSGNEIGMRFPEPETIGKPVDKDQIEKIARDFIRANLTKNENDYQMESQSYSEQGENYNCVFRKFYSGYPSEDTIMVNILSDGTIIDYLAMNIDIFNDITVPEIDENYIEKSVKSEVNKISDADDYKITYKIIVYSMNQKLQMFVHVDLTHTDGTVSNETYYIDL